MENIGLIVILLFGVSFLAILSKRLRFQFPIALVICGLVISLIPGLPVISLRPDIVFLIFLPPLLFSAAWNTSWNHFKANKRPITLAAVGLVLFTTVIVAVFAHEFIPGMSWPLGFLLGAIVSPPDAVAATSITKGLGLHPRVVSILEGESLVNDASSLIAYKYAIIVVMVGNFVLWRAGMSFVVVAGGGIVVGLGFGYVMYLVQKHFICEPIMEVTLTFLTAFAAYLIAEYFHFSGVLAVVSSGLFLSYYSVSIFSNEGRIMIYAVWDFVEFILNGLIFILIGLQLRDVMAGISNYSMGELLFYGLLISVVVIVVRFVFLIPAAMLPRILSRRIKEQESFDFRNLIIIGWSGMRGMVSMAAALALPLTLADGTDFPLRNLIIFLTFCVILSTLVLLGLTLPWIIRKLRLEPHSVVAEEYEVRMSVVTDTIQYIEEHLSTLQDQLLRDIKNKYEIKYSRLQKTDLPANYFGEDHVPDDTANIFNEFSKLQIDVIAVERGILEKLHKQGKATEAILRKMERELDLEETRLQMEL